MRSVVGLVLAAAVGIHCSAPAELPGTASTEVAPTDAPATPPAPARPTPPADTEDAPTPNAPNHLSRRGPDLSTLIADESTHVTSTVVDPTSGATYAAGTYVKDVVIGGVLIKNRGDKDVFLLKLDASGGVEWVRGVGSAYADSEPRVSLAGAEINVIGLTDGAMDCGAGPLATWSSATFFFCVFGATDGASLSGGVFPTGTP